MKHQINGELYTLGELKRKLTAICERYQGRRVTGKAYEFVYWALKRRRPGLIYRPDIRAIENYSGKCFQAFIGGQWLSFSYYKACTGKRAENRQKIKEAFRFEVRYQIVNFREDELEKPENASLRKAYRRNCRSVHVDHRVPFHLLLQNFLDMEGLALEDVKVRHYKQDFRILSNRKLARRWHEFHLEYADLRLVTARDNMSKAVDFDLPLWRYSRKLEDHCIPS